MPVDVLMEIEIDRPRAEVEEFAASPTMLRGGTPTSTRSSGRRDRRSRWGARVAFVARFLGRELDYTYEVKSLLPGELLVTATTEGRFTTEMTYTRTDTAEGGTRMTLRNRTLDLLIRDPQPSGVTSR